MRNMCLECPKRPVCRRLCPEAREYADQDQKDRLNGPNSTRLLLYGPEKFRRLVFTPLADLEVSNVELGPEEWSIIEKKARLSGRESEVLWLQYWMGLPRAQIAGALGVAVGAIDRYGNRARIKIMQRVFPERFGFIPGTPWKRTEGLKNGPVGPVADSEKGE